MLMGDLSNALATPSNEDCPALGGAFEIEVGGDEGVDIMLVPLNRCHHGRSLGNDLMRSSGNGLGIEGLGGNRQSYT